MKTSYPHLYEFFGGYFHQDWTEESSTTTGIVELYVNQFPANEVLEALKELRDLLANTPEESELANVVHDLGSFYNPQADGLTYQEWLTQVCTQLLELLGSASD